MKKILLVGTALASTAGDATADTVDITLGAGLDMGWDFGLGKAASSSNGFGMLALSSYHHRRTGPCRHHRCRFALRAGDSRDGRYSPRPPHGTTFARKYAFRLHSSNEVNLRGGGYNVSGGEAVSSGQIVAVKINSEWASKDASVTAYAQQLDDLGINNITNICKLAGHYADNMNGRAATGLGTAMPAGGNAVAPVFRTIVGNGRALGDDIYVDTGGMYGKVLRPGQFKAQRQIWATSPAGGNHVVPCRSALRWAPGSQ